MHSTYKILQFTDIGYLKPLSLTQIIQLCLLRAPTKECIINLSLQWFLHIDSLETLLGTSQIGISLILNKMYYSQSN